MERRRLAMSKVVLDVAMSLDGFTAGPNVRQDEPMGDGGERLHEWMWTAGNGPEPAGRTFGGSGSTISTEVMVVGVAAAASRCTWSSMSKTGRLQHRCLRCRRSRRLPD